MSKLHQQIIKIEAVGVQGHILLRSFEVLKVLFLLWVFCSAKRLPRIENDIFFGRSFGSEWFVWEGSVGEAVCRGGERGGVTENCSCVFKS